MESVKILITGDFCPINRIESLALDNKHKAIINDYIDVFQGNDLNIVDLECPLTLTEKKRIKYGPHQKAHPQNIGILKYANVNLVTMANNHIMDFGSQGAIDTIDLCKENGIETVGIGKDFEEAADPYTEIIKGRRIAILNYADEEFITSRDGLFTCNPLNPLKMFYDIQNAKAQNERVIIIVHGGNEHYQLPSPRIKALYRYLVDIGSDVVVAHHTHIYSGYEIYNGKPIFYGLGNFIYDWPENEDRGWNWGYAVRLEISERIDFELIPLRQGGEDPGVFHLSHEQKVEFQNSIEELNRIILDDTLIEAEFKIYCKKVYPMYEDFIEPKVGAVLTHLRRRGFFPRFVSRRKRLLLLNLIRCESHRDVLVRMLKKYE
jgi:poly-gamma-glutamate synthesis protein (capsule biosynthesis protein)